MATSYRTPGVYIQEISKFPPSITEVQTAIPAFIGFTEKAENNGKPLADFSPIRITSLLEYETFFGKDQRETSIVVDIKIDSEGSRYSVGFEKEGDVVKRSKHNMYQTMRLFFLNGGGPCYIISTGPYSNIGEPFNDPSTPFLAALEALKKFDEPTLIVFPEGQNMDQASYFIILEAALAQAEKLKDRFVIMDLHHSGEGLKTSNHLFSEGDPKGKVVEFREGVKNYLNYGAVYFPNILSDFNYSYDPANPAKVKKNGVDVPFNELTSIERSAVKLAIDNFPINMPPSGAVAGIYARVDNNRGVWKAPANEAIAGVSGLTFDINDEIQDNLNVNDTAGKSINAIRFFSGKGVKVWGARTLDGSSNEWRYVPVRRFFIMVEESCKKATDNFVFEPNDANTWVKVRAMIENFLLLQWRAGALAGAKPEHAFYVRVGINETMTAQDILEGRMIVEIGMAVVRPAEFIILRFSHKMQES